MSTIFFLLPRPDFRSPFLPVPFSRRTAFQTNKAAGFLNPRRRNTDIFLSQVISFLFPGSKHRYQSAEGNKHQYEQQSEAAVVAGRR